MSNEKQKILEMLENGNISAQEAAQLLDCVGGDETATAAADTNPAKSVSSGKKLRVLVKGAVPDYPKIDVNVSVPMALVHMVDVIIANCLPEAANIELAKQGINLKALNLSGMAEALETLDEDIVDVDINSEGTNIKVRVYVE